jgi:hypothetical protein
MKTGNPQGCARCLPLPRPRVAVTLSAPDTPASKKKACFAALNRKIIECMDVESA